MYSTTFSHQIDQGNQPYLDWLGQIVPEKWKTSRAVKYSTLKPPYFQGEYVRLNISSLSRSTVLLLYQDKKKNSGSYFTLVIATLHKYRIIWITLEFHGSGTWGGQWEFHVLEKGCECNVASFGHSLNFHQSCFFSFLRDWITLQYSYLKG